MMNSEVTAWMLVVTVMFMVFAGLELFIRGLSHKKNDIITFAMSYVIFCLATIFWICAIDNIFFNRNGQLNQEMFVAVSLSHKSKKRLTQ